MWLQYRDVFTSLDQDESVSVIIISGVGDHFCAGLDLKSAAKELHEVALYDHIREFQACISVTASISTPTVCLIHGLAYGLAVDILAATSIRVVCRNARLSIKEIQLGIVADMGSLQRLPRLVSNQSLLSKLALTGADFGYSTAIELGLVSSGDVADDKKSGLQICRELAEQIAANEHWCIKETKAALTFINEGGSAKEGLERVAMANSKMIEFPKLIRTIRRIVKL